MTPSYGKPKIAYFGSDKICLPGLRYLFEETRDICKLDLIVSQPDRRAGRGKRMQQNPVAEFARSHGIQLLQPDKSDEDLAALLRNAEISLAFVMAYGHFLPKAIREAPDQGILNFHGSILPAYRGASPVETAICLGERETGVCLMQVVREMDAGGVADCERVRIVDQYTAQELRAKIGEAVVPLLRRNLSDAINGELEFKAQDHHKASFCRKIRKEDAALDFNQSARQIVCRLRGFTPWPGGYFDHGADRIKVGRADWLAATVAPALPGTVLAAGGALEVATSDGILRMFELQRPGGRMLEVKSFLQGYGIAPGAVLPSVSGEPLLHHQADQG